eukprot:7723646-Lingulodinium_polyedra.AAC.1
MIKALLRYDKRRAGARGRCLMQDIPSLGVEAGDRLEPQLGLVDISQFEELSVPCEVILWRQPNETIAKHRCPLFS